MCESIKEFLVVRAGLVVLSSNIVTSQILNSFKNLWKLPLGVLITRHWELACYRKQTWLFTRGCSSYMQSSQQGGRLNMIITVLGEMVLVLGACAMICHVFVSMYLYMCVFIFVCVCFSICFCCLCDFACWVASVCFHLCIPVFSICIFAHVFVYVQLCPCFLCRGYNKTSTRSEFLDCLGKSTS